MYWLYSCLIVLRLHCYFEIDFLLVWLYWMLACIVILQLLVFCVLGVIYVWLFYLICVILCDCLYLQLCFLCLGGLFAVVLFMLWVL